MGERIYLNNDWLFSENFEENMLTEKMTKEQGWTVRLPHTTVQTPLHYFDAELYQTVSCYQRLLKWDNRFEGKTVQLTVEAAGHVASVYLNGKLLANHRCGYTAFTVDLTGKLLTKGKNLITIKVDNRESLNVPPFGGDMDGMAYGGLYREVYLEILDPCHIDDVFSKVHLTEDGVRLDCDIYVSRACRNQDIHTVQSIYSDTGALLAKMPQDKDSYLFHNVSLWTPETPTLYTLKTELFKGDMLVDIREDLIGFREAEFKADGFYLNGEKYKLRGINRHQSYPYVGYAMPESMQKFDAELIKTELGLNAVRTCHELPSQHFLNWCDRLGLLVIVDFPGWKYVGDDVWKDQAIENIWELIPQYRNHPSIILWDTRISDAEDDTEFFARTNQTTHVLDETRQTGGARSLRQGSIQEDVYGYNQGSALSSREEATADTEKGFLFSRYGALEAKPFDSETRRTEQMLRHGAAMNAYFEDDSTAGGFGWCMADYNIHRHNSCGDSVSYSGIMDMFRNPKSAAFLYASQQDESPVLEISSGMFPGEYAEEPVKGPYAVTNADSVRVYKNDQFQQEYTDSPYSCLPHGPILLDGCCPDGQKDVYRFEGIRDNQVVSTVVKGCDDGVVLRAVPSHTQLAEGNTYDVAAIRIQAVSGNGNLLSYFQEPVFLTVSGNLELIGSDVISLKGGMCGTYVRTVGTAGSGALTVSVDGCAPVTIDFEITK